MRLFEYFKILFGRKKPKLAKNEDVVYGQHYLAYSFTITDAPPKPELQKQRFRISKRQTQV